MKQLRISHKIWIAIGLIAIGTVGVVGTATHYIGEVQTSSQALMDDIGERQRIVSQWTGLTEANAARTLAVIMSSDAAVQELFAGDMKVTSAKISELQKKLGAMALSADEQEQITRISQARTNMLEQRKRTTDLRDAGHHDDARQLVKTAYIPASDAYLQTLHDFVRMQTDNVGATRQAVASAQDRAIVYELAGMGALLVLIALSAFFLIRGIQRPLRRANELAERIAQGDLRDAALDDGGTDEFGELLRSLRSMRLALVRMVTDVRHSSEHIATASSQIAGGNQDLSARTESTSSNLEETAAAMEQFTSTIQQSADSARQASQLADSASELAQKGGAAVSEVVSRMGDIEDSSNTINDIISVIDGIAFQTNILALNAAVEAARAGEQGRGFAVVAGEVRTLAQRSADAAKQIKELIGTSVERVESGSKLAREAGQTIQEMVQAVQRVTSMFGEITTAAAEQSTGVAEVNQAVRQLDQMTQQNAALVQQSTAAAQNLSEQAEHLAQLVQAFRLDEAAAAESTTTAVKPVTQAHQAAARTLTSGPDKKPASGARQAAPRLHLAAAGASTAVAVE